jgi:site-specific DNA-methyltransferase (adenine-specific)
VVEAERAFDQVMQAMMAVRLLDLNGCLQPTGSLCLHCDPTPSHYLKLLLDAVFGPERFLNEIIWKRTHSHWDRSS